ncbi:hypothetical protein N7G274_002422 [Stereocaulon virgatum]|uniref:Cytochrome P450 n=1 Tax=Stereocaulon virgatum TaxID=373712 RepID=A0ABR4AIN1_9LECA
MAIHANSSAWILVLQSCLVLLAGVTVRFCTKLYHVRHRFQLMQKAGLPMPPHHPIFGHLRLVGGIMTKLPKDVHGHVLPHQIRLTLPDLGPVFYIDTWPFGPPMLVIAASDQAYQITQVHSLPKFYALRDYMRPMTGGSDLITLEGEEWKRWRSIFKPGFKNSHLMALVPEMVNEISTFCEVLRDLARRQRIFSMDHVATRLTLDIIGRVVLNTRLNAQQSENEFVTVMRDQVRWLSFGNEANLFERYHPLRPIMRRWNDRKMRLYISRLLDLRFKSSGGNIQVAKQNRNNTIVDLALTTYQNEKGQGKSDTTLDTVFQGFAISQIRTFLFAGHDSTSSAICYTFHLLSTNPSARRRLISEHDRVLGPCQDRVSSQISANPHLLNQLPYTLAVVKEALRLYPPASSTRSGEPSHFITDLTGRQLPTDGFLVWSNSYAIHRDPNLWPDPDRFCPERWLVEKGDRLYPQQGNFRPFEFGPRNCIGQELAMLELKLVLVMTIRGFEVTSVYEEWDRLNPINGTKTINGDRAYQILSGAAHPSDGLPCRVSLVAH